MGKRGKKAQAGKAKKITPKEIGKRLDALEKKLEEELKGADLFAPLPPMNDCPICLLRLSRAPDQSCFQVCCGQTVCIGCSGEQTEFISKQNAQNAGKANKSHLVKTCPFCREPTPTGDEFLKQIELQASRGDPESCCAMGKAYLYGEYGLHRNDLRALDYWIRAVELGSAEACATLGIIFEKGVAGLSIDKGRAALFDKAGAILGNVQSRHNIGCVEYFDFGNHELGIRHWKIAAEAGSQPSLDALKAIYNADDKEPGKKYISKEDMDRIYRAGHEAQEMVKSEEREKHLDWEDKINLKC